MTTKRTLDRIGGAGCLLISVGCMWLAFRDWDLGLSMWKVWVGMSVLLFGNGVAMILHAQRKGGVAMEAAASPVPGVVVRSPRV